jgi:protein phosphatase
MASALHEWMELHLASPARKEPTIVVLPQMLRDSKSRWEAVAATDRGLVRQGNEDAYGLRVEEGAFVVCDGMGGAAAGEVASHMATESFLAWLEGSDRLDAATVRQAVRSADDAIRNAASKDSALRGMGTTLVALLVQQDGSRAWLTHAGDSRCYRLREKHLEQLTADHSFVEEQVRSGQLTAEEAQRSPLRNVITRAIGSSEPTEPEITEVDLSPGDVYLLCSDGLTREVRDEKLRSVLNDQKNLTLACTDLVQMANASGGRDNITCMLVRIL